MHQAGITDVDVNEVGFFRYRRLGDDYLITNDFGDWTWLSGEELKAFVEGKLQASDALRTRLLEKRFIHGELDLDSAVSRYANRHGFLHHGPGQHILALTGTNAEGGSIEMSAELADRAVDCAFMSTNPALTLVLVGANPLSQTELLEHIQGYVTDKNRLARKTVEFVVVAPLAGLTSEAVAWLKTHGMNLHLVADSDAATAVRETATSLAELREAWSEGGHRFTLVVDLGHGSGDTSPSELVDAAAEAGFDTMDLSPVATWTYGNGEGGETGPDAETWVSLWSEALDRMVHHETEGRSLRETTASELLAAILDGQPPALPQLRSPGVDGIGQLAYHADGQVFASELGRQVFDRLGDELFSIGTLQHHGYHDMITGPTVRSLLMASVLDGQPGWSTWVYKPYAGVHPAASYMEHGSIHGRMADSSYAALMTGICDALFDRLRVQDTSVTNAFRRWADLDPE